MCRYGKIVRIIHMGRKDGFSLKKYKRFLATFLGIILFLFSGNILFRLNALDVDHLSKKKSPLVFSPEEKEYIEANKNRRFLLGMDVHSGIYYFENYGRTYGYIHEILRLIRQETGLTVDLHGYDHWKDVLRGLRTDEVDIIIGANQTEARLEYMSFSKPIIREPYVVFANKNSDIRSIADFDAKTVAFLDGDIGIDGFREKFNQVYPRRVVSYFSPAEALSALSNNQIDGFIVTGGTVANKYLYDFPMIAEIAEIDSITSDMTLSTRKSDVLFTRILNKILDRYADGEIADAIKQAQIDFNRKILNLTKEELDWIYENPVITAGMADNYLPMDYYDQGQYKGIGGAVLSKACSLVGLEINVLHGEFSGIYRRATQGYIDVINMSKSEARLKHFIFTRPFSSERDKIYGRKDSPYVMDIYGLEGKKVCFIPGFWQYDSLRKNLTGSIFVEARDIQECLDFVRIGKADYFIENPTVADFYINGLKYSQIVERGIATSDSVQYLAIHRSKPLLASILDKALLLVSYEQEKYNGLMDIPELVPPQYRNMTLLVILLSAMILLISFFVFQTLKHLAQTKAHNELLEERTRMLYIDPLTGVRNRVYFYEISKQLDDMPFPQAYVVIDINNLKFVNDTYGHDMGDQLIRKCSDVLSEVFKNELIFRMGGDEFLVIYCPKNPEQVSNDLCRVSELTSRMTLQNDMVCVENLSMASGSYIRSSSEEPYQKAIREADNAMYCIKKKMKSSEDLIFH